MQGEVRKLDYAKQDLFSPTDHNDDTKVTQQQRGSQSGKSYDNSPAQWRIQDFPDGVGRA